MTLEFIWVETVLEYYVSICVYEPKCLIMWEYVCQWEHSVFLHNPNAYRSILFPFSSNLWRVSMPTEKKEIPRRALGVDPKAKDFYVRYTHLCHDATWKEHIIYVPWRRCSPRVLLLLSCHWPTKTSRVRQHSSRAKPLSLFSMRTMRPQFDNLNLLYIMSSVHLWTLLFLLRYESQASLGEKNKWKYFFLQQFMAVQKQKKNEVCPITNNKK